MINRENVAERIGSTARLQISDRQHSSSRRGFLAGIPGAAAVTLASTALPLTGTARADVVDSSAASRVQESYEIREEAAREDSKIPAPRQVTNGDEQTPGLKFIGNFSKGLPHNPVGEVDPNAYFAFLNAARQGTAAAFEAVPLGGKGPDAVKLVNPLAGMAFDLEGIDSHQFAIPPFPSVTSRELADQAVELYWMALCRDVNFTTYGSDPLVQAAAAELSSLQKFKGPKSGGLVTPQTLFRGFTAGDVIGPYVSQFLLRPFNYGPYAMSGTMNMYKAGADYLTDQTSWLNCQNGQGPFLPNMLEAAPRFTCTGRDLTVYVHTDPNAGLLISFYNAGIWLFQQNAPLNRGNPYTKYKTQAGFATFGVPHFLGLLGEAKQRACKAAWYAKWFVLRALRPEAYGGLVHMKKMHQQLDYPLDRDVLNSAAADRVFKKYHSYFLPQTFPEGSPQHPSYPQGHATMAGACATILKAAFDGGIQFNMLSNGDIVTADGDGLVSYTGPDAEQVTLNGEIDKLASNIGQARDFAGLHWRSDYEWGLRLGEAVAISLLRDQNNDYAGEDFEGFEITTFDGKGITV